MRTPRPTHLGLALVLAAALLFPLVVTNQYFVSVIVTAYIIAIAVYGLNVLVGYTGQLSLAHAGFFGIGAYTTGILMATHGVSFWLALPAALVVTCVLGFLVGMIALRTRGDYFAIFTLAVGVIITIVIDHWESVTGGTDGLIGIPPPTAFGPLNFESLTALYYLVLFFLLLTLYMVWALVNSLVGRTFVAIRNSDELARAIGIDVGRNQRLSFVISTGFAGLAGALYATFLGYIGPGMSSIIMTFNMLLFLMLGGVASLSGPLVGTLLVTLVMQALQAFEEYQLVIFGPLLVIVMIFFPYGLAGFWRILAHKWQHHRRSGKRGAELRVEAAPSSNPRERIHAAPGRESGD